MKWYIIVAIAIVALIFFFFPKQGCSCFGVEGSSCYGMPLKKCTESTCELSCDIKEQLYGDADFSLEQNKIYTILLIDASKSMEGQTMTATKEASKQLVQQTKNHEYVAVIEFNDKVNTLSEFSNDQFALSGRIELIQPNGKTRFTEAFQTAQNLFLPISKQAKKNIIFLSDGLPEDNEESYITYVNQLKQQGVSIYTISFEEEAKDVFSKLATSTDNIYIVDSEKEISNAFTNIYEDIDTQKDIIFSINGLEQTMNQEDSFQVKLFSAHNGVEIISNESVCKQEPDIILEAKQNFKKQLIKPTYMDGTYNFDLNTLEPGTHELIIKSTMEFGSCSMTGTKYLGTVIVTPKQNTCELNCQQINTILTNNKNISYARPNKSISWTIAIDTSDSMAPNLVQVKKDVASFISLIPKTDSVALISFDSTPKLIINHTTDKEQIISRLQEVKVKRTTQFKQAFELIQTVSKNSPYSNKHIILFSDGRFNDNPTTNIVTDLQEQNICFSSLSYDVSILDNKPLFFEELKKHRACGISIFTKPTQHDLLELAQVNKINQPTMEYEIQISSHDEKTSIHLIPYSTFTKKELVYKNTTCDVSPTTIIELKDNENNTIQTINGNDATFDQGEGVLITGTFGSENCQYKTQTFVSSHLRQDKKSPIGKILLAVGIVVVIYIGSFIIVLKRKIKKLKDKEKQSKTQSLQESKTDTKQENQTSE